jgi:hypothetical protein
MIARMRENLIGFPKACVRAISFQARMTSPDARLCCGFATAAVPAVVARSSPAQAVDTIRRIRDTASPDVVDGPAAGGYLLAELLPPSGDDQVGGALAAVRPEVISFVRWRP